MSDYKKDVGAVWVKPMRDGKEFLSMQIEHKMTCPGCNISITSNDKYVAWPNKRKLQPQHPHFKIQEDNYGKDNNFPNPVNPNKPLVVSKDPPVEMFDNETLPF